MAIIDSLNSLESKINTAKQTLVTNLTDKGVANITTANTLTEIAESVTSISAGGLYDFESIGYTGEEEPLKSALAYAQKIYNKWNPSSTSMSSRFSFEWKLIFLPLIDTSNVTDMSYAFYGDKHLICVPQLNTSKANDISNMFDGCSSLTTIPPLDTSNVTNMFMMFYECEKLTTIPPLDTSKVTNLSNSFGGCSSLETIPIIDLSSATEAVNMFDRCSSLNSIKLVGNPSKLKSITGMFGSSASTALAKNGTLIYDYRYDYSKIIDELKKFNSSWTIKADNAQ